MPAARIHRMRGELGPREGASRYAQAFAVRLGPGAPQGEAALDLVILGIGPDAHIASLFPGAAALAADEQELCRGVEDSPKPPPQRITLTLPCCEQRAAACCSPPERARPTQSARCSASRPATCPRACCDASA